MVESLLWLSKVSIFTYIIFLIITCYFLFVFWKNVLNRDLLNLKYTADDEERLVFWLLIAMLGISAGSILGILSVIHGWHL